MNKQKEIEQLSALATNCERDMHQAIAEREQSARLVNDIHRLIKGEVYVIEVGVQQPALKAEPQAATDLTDVQMCCCDYAKCHRACTPRGRWLALREALATPVVPEMHDALCPALTGGACTCSQNPMGVDKAWAQFCGGIGRGPNAPYPGMLDAFEAHYGQSFTDKDWRTETGIWAAAWKAALAAAPVVPPGYAPVPGGAVRAEAGFRFDGMKQEHIPTLLVEFAPVAVGDPDGGQAKGWKDRDALLALVAAAPKPKEQT